MQKIVSLFQRNYDGDRLVRDEVVPEASWVTRGEGRATRKWDGTCCRVLAGRLFARYDLPLTKEYKNKKRQGYQGPTWDHVIPPNTWTPAQTTYDTKSGHWPGWMPVGEEPEYKWHREAWANDDGTLPDGTYELLGPKIQGNPEALDNHWLYPHGETEEYAPRDFEGLKSYFQYHNIEGIVWHHPDGRMVKIKAKDFGLRRGEKATRGLAQSVNPQVRP